MRENTFVIIIKEINHVDQDFVAIFLFIHLFEAKNRDISKYR